MYEIPKNEKGGANASYKPAGYYPESHGDNVGLSAGEKVPAGSADGIGTDRGFHAVRDTMMGYNLQNTHEIVNPEYTRGVGYGGQVKFPTEP